MWFGNSVHLIPLLCLALVVIQLLWGVLNLASNYLFVKVGLQALLKLRTDYKQQQGKSISLRTFHDTLLGHGTAPFWLQIHCGSARSVRGKTTRLNSGTTSREKGRAFMCWG